MRYQFLTVTVPYYEPTLQRVTNIRCNFAPMPGKLHIDRREARKLLGKILRANGMTGVTSSQLAQFIAHAQNRTYEEVREVFAKQLTALANRMEEEDETEDSGHPESQTASLTGSGV